MATVAEKKKRIIAHMKKYFDKMDKTKFSSKRLEDLINSFSKEEMDKFIARLKSGETILKLYTPNLKNNLEMSSLLKLADELKIKVFERLNIQTTDRDEGYITNPEFMVVRIPIRRTQQTVEHKRALPHEDKKIDVLTGQRMGDDRAARFTNPELQALLGRGLKSTVEELMRYRGGDILNYSLYKAALEDTGGVNNNDLDPNSKTRSSVVLSVMLKSMGIDNNLLEGGIPNE